MKRTSISLLALFLAMSFGSAALAQVTLRVGDVAPPLTGGKWLKGEPVKDFEAGKIYVVEFWATWCGPCRESIPHVTEMQKKFAKDNVIFIGQDCWEQDEAAIDPFMKEMGDKMDYRVVADSKIGDEGNMAVSYLTASQNLAIPCAFLIDKTGKIAWIGHPMELEPKIEKLIAGTLDPKKEAEEQAAMEKMQQLVNQAMHGGDADQALKAIDDFANAHPEAAKQVEFTRFQLLLLSKNLDGALKSGQAVFENSKDAAEPLNALAWTIVQSGKPGKKLVDLASKAALRADELTQSKNYQILDTLAHVQFMRGEIDKAIDTEDKAIHLAPENEQVDLQGNLDEYMAAKKNKK